MFYKLRVSLIKIYLILEEKMEYWDIEDFIEEVKFMLTEYDEMTKEIILDWEKKFREWIDKKSGSKYIKYKSEEEIYIQVKDENIMYDIALRYHNAYRKKTFDDYWKNLKIVM